MTKKPRHYVFGYDAGRGEGQLTTFRAEVDDLLCDLAFDDRTHGPADPMRPCFDAQDERLKAPMDIAQPGVDRQTIWEKLGAFLGHP